MAQLLRINGSQIDIDIIRVVRILLFAIPVQIEICGQLSVFRPVIEDDVAAHLPTVCRARADRGESILQIAQIDPQPGISLLIVSQQQCTEVMFIVSDFQMSVHLAEAVLDFHGKDLVIEKTRALCPVTACIVEGELKLVLGKQQHPCAFNIRLTDFTDAL